MLLKEFAYLDRQRIQDFISLLEGGLAKEMTEKKQKISAEARGEVSIPRLAKLSGGLERKGTESEELKTATEVSLFQRLNTYLDKEKLCRRLDSVDEKVLREIKRRELVEFEGNVEVSAMDKVFKILASYANFFPVKNEKSKFTMSLVNKVISREGFNIKVTHINEPRFKFVGYLLKKNLRVETEELEDEYCILCRVKRVLKPNKSLDLFSLPQIRMPKSIIHGLIQSFENLPPQSRMLFSKPIGMEDFKIPYPAVLVTPIAIYR